METTEIIVAIVGSNALSITLSKLFDLFGKRKINDKIHQMLILDVLKRHCEKAISRAYISYSEMEWLEKMYKLYKQIGGNGYADLLMDSVRELRLGETNDIH